MIVVWCYVVYMAYINKFYVFQQVKEKSKWYSFFGGITQSEYEFMFFYTIVSLILMFLKKNIGLILFIFYLPDGGKIKYAALWWQ